MCVLHNENSNAKIPLNIDKKKKNTENRRTKLFKNGLFSCDLTWLMVCICNLQTSDSTNSECQTAKSNKYGKMECLAIFFFFELNRQTLR